jgi:predicted nucleotidyltransferase
MTATVKDYHFVVDGLIEDVRRIGDDVRSVVLFGSVVRGDVIAGQSDLMDAYIFLRHEVFEDKQRFLNAIEALSEAFDRIGERAPGPFHPFFYWDEIDPVPATFKHELTSVSKVMFGDDLRDRIKATAESRATARTSFFEMRRLGSQMMAYLRKKDLTEDDCQTIFRVLIGIRRDMPISACMALNIWVGQMEAIRELEKALPGLDMKAIESIAMLQRQPQPTADPERVRDVLKQVVALVEDLNTRIIDKVKDEAWS